MVNFRKSAMIIGMAVIFPCLHSSVAWATLPDPVFFSNQMELGATEKAEQWLNEGLPVDFIGSRIGSGLQIAAWEGNIPLMQLFVSRGANVNLLNRNGESALALAAWRGHKEAVTWLLTQGAKLSPGGKQWTALHYAVFAGQQDIVNQLLEKGADVNALSTNGSTPLMMAIYEGREDLAKLLLEKGANPSLRNEWNDGAMEWAMRYNRPGIAKMVSTAEEYLQAMNQPKEKWGTPTRSMQSTTELDNLLTMRRRLVDRNLSTDLIDKKIAAERMRAVRAELDKAGPMARAASLEISASRKAPTHQSSQIVYDDQGKSVGFKAPATTYYGTPKMPVKANVKNY